MAQRSTVGNLNKVWETKALKSPHAIPAKAVLERIAAQVNPLLQQRGWQVKQLCEFFPKDAHLLGMNVNKGKKILLRLRPADNPNTFYSYEFILGTMIHELAHIAVSPHNQAFYAEMDRISDELTELAAAGVVTMQGTSHRLQGKRPLGAHGARDAMAAAAEKRAQHQQLFHSGGRKLGGKAVSSKAELKQRMASAAERRLQDNLWCPAETSPELGVDNDEDDPASWTCLNCTLSNITNANTCAACGAARPAVESGQKGCPCCTFINSSGSSTCAICGENLDFVAAMDREKTFSSLDWSCSTCTAMNSADATTCTCCSAPAEALVQATSSNRWACVICTFENAESVNECQICRTRRVRKGTTPPDIIDLVDHDDAVDSKRIRF